MLNDWQSHQSIAHLLHLKQHHIHNGVIATHDLWLFETCSSLPSLSCQTFRQGATS